MIVITCTASHVLLRSTGTSGRMLGSNTWGQKSPSNSVTVATAAAEAMTSSGEAAYTAFLWTLVAEDQTLRGLFDLMVASTRTNYFLGRDYISFKIGIKVFLHTDEPCMPLFLNTFPYTPENVSGLKAMEGILPLNNKLKQKLNVNMIIHQQAFKNKLVAGGGVYVIRPGTPLAMLYFPGGAPRIEYRDYDPKVPTVQQSRHMKGSYLARMKDWFGG